MRDSFFKCGVKHIYISLESYWPSSPSSSAMRQGSMQYIANKSIYINMVDIGKMMGDLL
jgi:hypothetical protein